MNPRAIFILAACLMLWAVVSYKVVRRAPEPPGQPWGWERAGTTNTNNLAEWAFRAGANVAAKLVWENPGVYSNSHQVQNDAWNYAKRTTTDAVHNPDAQRVINELVEAGFSPEDAAEAYRLANESANERRTNRPTMPGVRTNIDAKRWPIFEE